MRTFSLKFRQYVVPEHRTVFFLLFISLNCKVPFKYVYFEVQRFLNFYLPYKYLFYLPVHAQQAIEVMIG